MDNLVKVSVAEDHDGNWYVLPFDLCDQFTDDVQVTPVGRNKEIVNRYNECLLTLGYNALELWTSLPVSSDKGGILDVDINRIEQVEIVFCPKGGMYIIPLSMYDEFKNDLALYSDYIDPFVTEEELYSKWRAYSVWGNTIQLPHVSFFTPPLANMDDIQALVRPLVECTFKENEIGEYVVPLDMVDVFESDQEELTEAQFKKKYRALRLLKENGDYAIVLYSYRVAQIKRFKKGGIKHEHHICSEQPERFMFARTMKHQYFIPSVLVDRFTKDDTNHCETDYEPKFFKKYNHYQRYQMGEDTTVYARLNFQ